MNDNTTAIIYGVIAMALMMAINFPVAKLLNLDIYILFFGDAIFFLAMILYEVDTIKKKRDEKR